MSLAHKSRHYIYIWSIKQDIRLAHHYIFFKKEDRPYMKSPTPKAKCAEGVFQIQSAICGVDFLKNTSRVKL